MKKNEMSNGAERNVHIYTVYNIYIYFFPDSIYVRLVGPLFRPSCHVQPLLIIFKTAHAEPQDDQIKGN